MIILVTGGAGFIGSQVVETSIDAGHVVHVADDLSTGSTHNVSALAAFHHVDIGSDTFRELFGEIRPDAVIHMAAQINVTASMSNPVFDAEASIINTIRLLDLCVANDVGRFVFASSAAVYGATETIPVDETFQCNPLSPYGVSKLACEEYVKLYGRSHGLPFVILRNSNVYGPRQIAQGECGVCAVLTQQMIRGEIPTLYGHGNPLRDYIYVGDVAGANLAALTHGDGSTLNVSSGEGVSVRVIFDRLKEFLEFGDEPRLAPLRPGEIENTYLSNQRAIEALCWNPETNLSDGLRLTVDHFRTR